MAMMAAAANRGDLAAAQQQSAAAAAYHGGGAQEFYEYQMQAEYAYQMQAEYAAAYSKYADMQQTHATHFDARAGGAPPLRALGGELASSAFTALGPPGGLGTAAAPQRISSGEPAPSAFAALPPRTGAALPAAVARHTLLRIGRHDPSRGVSNPAAVSSSTSMGRRSGPSAAMAVSSELSRQERERALESGEFTPGMWEPGNDSSASEDEYDEGEDDEGDYYATAAYDDDNDGDGRGSRSARGATAGKRKRVRKRNPGRRRQRVSSAYRGVSSRSEER